MSQVDNVFFVVDENNDIELKRFNSDASDTYTIPLYYKGNNKISSLGQWLKENYVRKLKTND